MPLPVQLPADFSVGSSISLNQPRLFLVLVLAVLVLAAGLVFVLVVLHILRTVLTIGTVFRIIVAVAHFVIFIISGHF